jgi:hypothetical protein
MLFVRIARFVFVEEGLMNFVPWIENEILLKMWMGLIYLSSFFIMGLMLNEDVFNFYIS